MPTKLKLSAVALTLLAAVLLIFFMTSKHNPALAAACPFAEDPFDAVGSFAVQLVPLTALLACMRAFRPCSQAACDADREMLAGTLSIGFSAILVTVLADTVALARYPRVWIAATGGRALVLCLATLAAAAAAGLAPLQACLRKGSRDSRRALAVLTLAAVALGCWPPLLHRGVWGSLLTAFVGSAIFFLMLWSLAPAPASLSSDALDDLAAWVRPLSTRLAIRRPQQKAAGPGSLPHARTHSLRRYARTHPRRLVLLAGVLIGSLLLSLELRGERTSIPLSRLAPVASAFLGLEVSGMALGYALLSSPLGLFRKHPSV